MFKPGEIAGVRAGVAWSQRVARVTIVSPTVKVPVGDGVMVEARLTGPNHKWPVITSAGVFSESELFVAHPTVLATAEGRDLSREAFAERFNSTPKNEEGLSFELRDQVEKILKKARLDLNGHWRSGKMLHKGFKPLRDLFLGPKVMSKKDALALIRAKAPLARWIGVKAHLSSLRGCPTCGDEEFKLETNGKVVRLAGAPCKYPKGLPPTEWELNVPSGKLVIANDLRRLFPLPEDPDFDVNTTLGCRQTALAYAENGMSHAFVGNTCPGVYKCKDGTYKIAGKPSDEDWDEKKKKWVKIKPVPKFDGKRVAGICTDLWWYSICDHDEYERRRERFEQTRDFMVEIVKVKPGVYRFRHDEHAREKDGPKECVYTRFEWVRKPDPVRDLIRAYDVVDVNPNAYVQASAARWPTLFGTANPLDEKGTTIPWDKMSKEQQHASWQRVADHTMCTIGAGIEWHEKGFPRAKVDASIPDVEPPSFREQHHWYPFSKPYGGLFEPSTLTPSFAKLAFRILESVISFGMTVRDDAHSREVRGTRERMLTAVKRYRELAKQHPNEADPEYVAWLSEEGRAEAWVKNFQLGPEFTEKHRKHAENQRWVPEGTYAVEFDARKLKSGHFAWHPKQPGVGGCWAKKEDAQRYALKAHEDNGQEGAHNCFWGGNAGASVPLYSVARVVKVGEVSHMGETLVEIIYDYGTPWMKDPAKRKALAEQPEKEGIRVLTREEYKALLPEAIKFFEEAERAVTRKKAVCP